MRLLLTPVVAIGLLVGGKSDKIGELVGGSGVAALGICGNDYLVADYAECVIAVSESVICARALLICGTADEDLKCR